MCLNTYLIYCLISCVIFISSIPFIYRERTKANIEEKSKGTDRSGRKRTRAAPRAVCHPDRLVLFPVLFHPSGGKGRQRKRARRMEGREGTRAKDSADLFARSSHLFCSVCCLHSPHHRQRPPSHAIAKRKGRTATPSASGRCHRHTSPHLVTD